MSDFNTELSATASTDSQERIKGFIDATVGYQGVTRDFLENFIRQFTCPDFFIETYRTAALHGVHDVLEGGGCPLGNKVGFYKRNREVILNWAHNVFDIELHESVHSMLAYDDYMKNHAFSYKDIKRFMAVDSGCPDGFSNYATAMVWIITQDLCAQMEVFEKERIDNECDLFIKELFHDIDD